MEQIKQLFVGIICGIVAYLNPISGNIRALIMIFVINGLVGMLTGTLVQKEPFNLKKAFRCCWEALCFLAMVCCLYYIGEHNGNKAGALQCVSYICLLIIYYYTRNVFKNLKIALKKDSILYKIVCILDYILGAEFVKKIPYLADYLEAETVKTNKQ